MNNQHDDFTMSSSGFVLNPEWPHLGASPDGIVNCSCCGRGVLEVKCPYTHRYNSVQDIARDSSSCLQTSDTDGSPYLDHDHAYYYQVQAQIFPTFLYALSHMALILKFTLNVSFLMANLYSQEY